MPNIAFTIEIERDDVTPFLQRATTALGSDRINAAVRRETLRLTKEHLARLDVERPNRLGGPRTNFYGRAARGTTAETTSDGVLITIASVGIGQRFFGGTITMKDRMLTIPARAEAYGKRASEFSNLRFAVLGRGGPALIEKEQTNLNFRKGKRIKGGRTTGGGVFFWLRRSVTHQPDPSVIPGDNEYIDAAVAGVARLVDKLDKNEGETEA